MLDLGFVRPIRRIVRELPRKRQNLFFSATMPPDIRKLAGELLHEPAEVSVAPAATTVERVEQKVLHVDASRKCDMLVELFTDPAFTRAIVFTRTKRGADRVARSLDEAGVNALAIHGNKSQGQRERALAAFRSGQARAMVATDIAARGIDIDDVSHVVNFELPDVAEAYVHRIGRTARAGAAGRAISLCDGDERPFLRSIEKLTRQTIPSEDRRDPRGAAHVPPEPRDDRPARPPRQYDRASERRGTGGPGRPAFDHKHGAPGQHRGDGTRPAASRPRSPGGRPPARGTGGPRQPA
jgi:ATP-dependent RNA helicase RhlE